MYYLTVASTGFILCCINLGLNEPPKLRFKDTSISNNWSWWRYSKDKIWTVGNQGDRTCDILVMRYLLVTEKIILVHILIQKSTVELLKQF